MKTAPEPIILSTWLIPFVSKAQREVMVQGARGEEKEFFISKMKELSELFHYSMPKTYDQDGMGDNATVYLHYFKDGFDWYITERDVEQNQLQAFGLACMFEDEMGYISIQELIQNGVELDLYWTPKTIGEIKKERMTENQKKLYGICAHGVIVEKIAGCPVPSPRFMTEEEANFLNSQKSGDWADAYEWKVLIQEKE